MVRNRDFWKEITEEELAEVREEVDADMEKVEEYDVEDIQAAANEGPRDGAYSFLCGNCGFKFRGNMDMGARCKVCGDTVYR